MFFQDNKSNENNSVYQNNDLGNENKEIYKNSDLSNENEQICRDNKIYENEAICQCNKTCGEKIEINLSNKDFQLLNLLKNVEGKTTEELFSAFLKFESVKVIKILNSDYNPNEMFEGENSELKNKIVKTIKNEKSNAYYMISAFWKLEQKFENKHFVYYEDFNRAFIQLSMTDSIIFEKTLRNMSSSGRGCFGKVFETQKREIIENNSENEIKTTRSVPKEKRKIFMQTDLYDFIKKEIFN